MRRAQWGLPLLLGLLGLCTAISLYTARWAGPVEEALAQAREEHLRGDAAGAAALAGQAAERWTQAKDLAAALCDHEALEDIESLFSQLPHAGEAFPMVCTQLEALVRKVREAESLRWNSLW